jgi:hypothetical protein
MSAIARTDAPPAGLVASPPQALPFAPDTDVRAFTLHRAAGPTVVYSVDGLGAVVAGAERQLLGHWHEALFASGRPDAPLVVHAADRAETERRGVHVRASFSRRHHVGPDLEAIPIPGHTPGATAYLWDAGGERVLFTGDSLWLRDGEWVAAVLDSSDRDAYLESLALLRELDFDVLVPWAASAGRPWFARTGAQDRRRRLDAVIARVRAGARS